MMSIFVSLLLIHFICEIISACLIYVNFNLCQFLCVNFIFVSTKFLSISICVNFNLCQFQSVSISLLFNLCNQFCMLNVSQYNFLSVSVSLINVKLL